MAQLTVDSLLGCNSIPDFIGTGTTMVFNNTAAPTSWTKVTTQNDKALRITNSVVGAGGSIGFSQIFPTINKTVTGTVSPSPAEVSGVSSETVSVTLTQINSITQSPITVNNEDVVLSQMSSHAHQVTRFPSADILQANLPNTPNVAVSGRADTTANTGGVDRPDGGGTAGSHSHPMPAGAQHSHTVNATAHTHSVVNTWQHTHNFSTSPQDFNILYVDIILAQKD
jgi:hypothetical protein